MSPNYFGAMLSMAAKNGINLIDTADAYGSGDAERLVGQCLRAERSQFFVMTKAGIPYVHTPGWLSPLNQIGKKVKAKAGFKKNFTTNYLVDSLHRSNKRMGIERADAFLLHEPEQEHLTDDSWAGLEKIRFAGLASYTGVYTKDYRVVEDGIRAGQLQVVQTSTAWNHSAADRLMALCRQHGIPVVANNVLQDNKALSGAFSQQANAIHGLAGLEGMSLVQFLIAAVLVQKPISTVLIGTTNQAHLEHNFGAVDYVPALLGQLDLFNQLLA